MALKPTKVNIETQVRPEDDGDLLTTHAGSPAWQTPAEAGIATEAYADNSAADALAAANQYTDEDRLEIDGLLAEKADLVNGKVPITQLPSPIMEYKGTWNANTNSPQLADGVGDTGDVYRVSVGGTIDLGAGVIEFHATDYVIYNGVIWQKSDTTDAVTTVNSQVGDVVITPASLGLGQVDNTADADKPISTATQNALNAKQDTLVSGANIKTINGESVVGSGDLEISAGGSADSLITTATLTLDTDQFDQISVTAQDQPFTIAAPTGTNSNKDGHRILYRLKDDGTSRAITWDPIFRPITDALPTGTEPSKTTYVGFIYNASSATFDLLAVATEV